MLDRQESVIPNLENKAQEKMSQLNSKESPT